MKETIQQKDLETKPTSQRLVSIDSKTAVPSSSRYFGTKYQGTDRQQRIKRREISLDLKDPACSAE